MGSDGRQWPLLVAAALPGLAALVALVFTWMSVAQTNKELRIAEEGQITTRFNGAVSHLGSSSQHVRFGGIYALERIMQDSARDQPRVISVLSAFVRTRAQVPATGFVKQQPSVAPRPPADVTAVINVLADRPIGHDGRAELDFSGADLRGLMLYPQTSELERTSGNPYLPPQTRLQFARLDGADLRGAEISHVDLDRASLARANLSGATFVGVDLEEAHLKEASLADMFLTRSNLYAATLSGADLSGANLTRTVLSFAYLDSADLSDARLSEAALTNAYLPGTNLEGSDVTVEQILSALPDSSTRLPEQLTRDPRVRERIAEVERGPGVPTPPPTPNDAQ